MIQSFLLDSFLKFHIVAESTGESLYIGDKRLINLNTLDKILEKTIHLAIIILLMAVTIKVGNKLINKLVKKQIESNYKFSMDEKKANTIGTLLQSILKYAVYFIGITTMLSSLFGNISWAFASVGGVAVGLGAQSFVKDVINGVFILFEEQFAVGDYITILNSPPIQGIVESIGLRTTELRDFNGDVNIIPNGSILTVTNHSKGNMRVLVDIEVAYETDIDYAMDVINGVCDKFNKTNENITSPLKALGVMSLNPSGVTIRVVGEAKPMTQWEIERNLRKELKIAL
ncbi:MAG: mechanosensitive ion channel family protein, partial [Sarcina sp.]